MSDKEQIIFGVPADTIYCMRKDCPNYGTNWKVDSYGTLEPGSMKRVVSVKLHFYCEEHTGEMMDISHVKPEDIQ